MRTPDGEWTVEIVATRAAGECFRVRRRAVIGVHGGRGWAPIGQLRSSIAEVAEMLGPRFADLDDVARVS
jgi:hypothetical protein